MRESAIGKKAAVMVIHQFFSVLMVIMVSGMGYFVKQKIYASMDLFAIFSIVGMAGCFVTLSYLANVTGEREDGKIHFHLIDKIPTEFILLLFAGLIVVIGKILKIIGGMEFSFAGIMVASGCLCYILDLVFLLIYLSIMRRLKGNILFTGSFIYKIYDFFREYFSKNPKKRFRTRKSRERYEIQEAIEAIAAGALETTLDESQFHGQEKDFAQAVNRIRQGLQTYARDSIKNERMKADLITNVSHDLKTPLTSIVNYVDLLKRENLDNESAKNYIRIIDEKSQRLKQLTEDLVEASKISSGNIHLERQKIDFVELLCQTGGEFNEKFEVRDLTIITKLPHTAVFVKADGRQLYRAVENLYNNAAKYALEKTRVYVELSEENGWAVFSMKNISKNPIQVEQGDYNQLTDRFVRGDISRTTEGSGLGLSIAKNLTHLMGGKFEILVNGDLFTATVSFPIAGK